MLPYRTTKTTRIYPNGSDIFTKAIPYGVLIVQDTFQ